MKHFWSLEDIHEKNTWLTIGTFDGVHRGHQEIIRQLSKGAHEAGSIAVVLTFFPHPAVVLGKRANPAYLTTPEEKAALLNRFGADVIITYPFTEFTASKTAEQFIKELNEHLQVHCLFAGHDFALGHNRRGDLSEIAKIGKRMGFCVNVITPFRLHGEIVSSSAIRGFLASGNVRQAALFLGRPYRIDGFVVEGDHRAQLLGAPTANLEVWAQRAKIENGVYACRVILDGKTYPAVTNIGLRPTFGSGQSKPQIETHILDFSADIYGKYLQLDFIERLRDEMKFESVDALRKQIQRDISSARDLLA